MQQTWHGFSSELQGQCALPARAQGCRRSTGLGVRSRVGAGGMRGSRWQQSTEAAASMGAVLPQPLWPASWGQTSGKRDASPAAEGDLTPWCQGQRMAPQQWPPSAAGWQLWANKLRVLCKPRTQGRLIQAAISLPDGPCVAAAPSISVLLSQSQISGVTQRYFPAPINL